MVSFYRLADLRGWGGGTHRDSTRCHFDTIVRHLSLLTTDGPHNSIDLRFILFMLKKHDC